MNENKTGTGRGGGKGLFLLGWSKSEAHKMLGPEGAKCHSVDTNSPELTGQGAHTEFVALRAETQVSRQV